MTLTPEPDNKIPAPVQIPEQINTLPDSLCCELVLPTGTLRLKGELTPHVITDTYPRNERDQPLMISLPAGSRIWLVAGITDMRNGFNGLASKVQNVLKDDPFSGHLFIFRGRRGDQIKVLWADSDGLCLFTKRLERGRFVWPVTRDGKVHLTPAQLSMLLEGINWKHPKRTERAGIRI